MLKGKGTIKSSFRLGLYHDLRDAFRIDLCRYEGHMVRNEAMSDDGWDTSGFTTDRDVIHDVLTHPFSWISKSSLK